MTRTKEIDARTKAATEGPWEYTETEDAVALGFTLGTRYYPLALIAKSTTTELPYEFGPSYKFIANAREDIPWLRAWQDRAVKAGSILVSRIEAEIDSCKSCVHEPCHVCSDNNAAIAVWANLLADLEGSPGREG